jgi:hypothetical protein
MNACGIARAFAAVLVCLIFLTVPQKLQQYEIQKEESPFNCCCFCPVCRIFLLLFFFFTLPLDFFWLFRPLETLLIRIRKATAEMSADPEMPVDASRYSGGHVMKTVWYQRTSSGQMEVATVWKAMGSREWNQWVVPPASEKMHAKHPCAALNRQLLECSDSQPEMMKLAGRCAACNAPRQQLMVCLTRNKTWQAPPEGKPWYQLW